ncbi:MAG: DUF5711 family protein [Oscillospiraceae bacterium]
MKKKKRQIPQEQTTENSIPRQLTKEEVAARRTDLQKLRKKRKIRRRLLVMLLVVLLVFLGAAGYITRNVWFPWLEDVTSRSGAAVVNDGTVAAGNFPLPISDTGENAVAGLGSYLVILSDTNIQYFNDNGKQLNSFQHTLGSPLAESNGDRILFYDLGGYTFTVANKKEVVYTKQLDDEILFARQAENGYTAVVTEMDKYPAYLTVYDKTGTEVFRWANGSRITDVTFTGEGGGCVVSSFKSANGGLVSEIHGLAFDRSEELYQIDQIDTLIYQTTETDDGNLWVVGESSLRKLSKDGTTLYDYETDNPVKTFALSPADAAIVTEGLARNTSVLVTSRSSDEAPASHTFTGTTVKLKCLNEIFYLLTEDGMLAYDGAGELKASADFDDNYSDFVYIDENMYLLGFRQVDKITFKS